MTANSFTTQPADVVWVRSPGNRQYGAPLAARVWAQPLADYAALSANVYAADWMERGGHRPAKRRKREPAQEAGEVLRACCQGTEPFDTSVWKRWPAFPSKTLIDEAEHVGLFFEVFETRTVDQPIVAVVFRGTDGVSWRDWMTNFRWLLGGLPGWRDQYDVVRGRFGDEFVKALTERLPQYRGAPRLVAAGHSLGGGLAQQFAYSIPREGTPVPAVHQVYAFDASPLTGWYSTPEARRAANANGLQIARVFEHGEIVAYLRLVFSYLYPPAVKDPAVTEARFNFNRSWNPFASHSMRALACHIVNIDVVGQEG